MFKVGDNIVYPMHGAGTIESIEERELLPGETTKYYVMKMPVGDIKVMVPTKNAEMIGVRDIIANESCNDVLQVFDNTNQVVTSNWNKRYRDNMERMRSGDIFEVAEVVRNLTFKQKEKGLATGEKKMLSNAKQILVSELVLAEDLNRESIEKMIDDRIDASFNAYMTGINA